MQVNIVTHVFDLDFLKSRLLPVASVSESRELGLPVAAVAIIIDPEYQGGSVLLIKRRERKGDPWSGQIAFPGGRKTATDQSLLETVFRETKEEVGIRLSKDEMLGVLPPLAGRSRRVVVTPYVFQLRHQVNVHPNYEVAETFWASLTQLKDIQSTKTEVNVEDGKLLADSYNCEGRVIWGLTFRIINTLLNKEQGPL